ncbi:MAG: deoxyribonuclease V [Elusimicrobiota bacterium]
MLIRKLHPWTITPKEASQLQNKLSRQISLNGSFRSLTEIKTVAGCDVHFSKDEFAAKAAVVVLSYPDLKLLAQLEVVRDIEWSFPYIPGLLSFREIPPLLEVFKQLSVEPDVVICDGQGIAHPRRLGLASHLGLVLDRPTIGSAKSLLYGEYEEPPPGIKGAYTYLKDVNGEYIGVALRTRSRVKPVFVSVGHKMDLEMAADLVLSCCRRYRLPEPVRLAHLLAGK